MQDESHEIRPWCHAVASGDPATTPDRKCARIVRTGGWDRTSVCEKKEAVLVRRPQSTVLAAWNTVRKTSVLPRILLRSVKH